ncbi:MAG: thiol oxidoreductase [Gammaproteobacteria bacterium]|nr:MAG: thiol oxidoreductase [Gammaproteobacteria bacterium]
MVCSLLILIVCVSAIADERTPVQGREAFGQPLAGLSTDELESFFRGRSLFRQSWVVAPAKDTLVGLGPLYNRISCASCHPKNGRGRAPENETERMQSMLVRLSVAGKDEHSAPKPHPIYGNQLNEEGVPGVPGEGIASIKWQEFEMALAAGTRVPMRKPLLSFYDLHYGPLDKVQTSMRVGSPVFGLGLLQSVAQTDLENFEKDVKSNGVKGKINWVWNAETQEIAVGRFGLKANNPSIRTQILDALIGDLGITSHLHPNENCMPLQVECLKAPSGNNPEFSDAQLADVEFYFLDVAAPARRNSDDPVVQKGETIFREIGCAQCHRETLHTEKNNQLPHLSELEIHPYTDLLIHDMGSGLADNREDFGASGRDWRTTPLWGIGLTQLISESQSYLHDGRARTLTEAILWHDGEAKISREKFAALSRVKRDAFETFLLSL